MTIKVFIKRQVPGNKIAELTVLLKRLRSVTLMQPGYISGRTMKRLDQPGECLVIGSWRSAEDWYAWAENSKRIAIQNEIDELLDSPTEYSVYE